MAIDNQSSNSGISSSSGLSSTSASSDFSSRSTAGASSPAASTSASTAAQPSSSMSSNQNAMDILRGSVTGVLESVVREYEPQIAQFTHSIAHQAVDRGVSFVQTAGQRIQKQSWLRLGLAAALGVGVVAVLSYEASEAAAGTSSDRSRSSVH